MNETRGVSNQFKLADISPLRLAGSLALLALLAASLDCSSTSCVPGASAACVGVAGCTGGQVCTADGEGYGPCMCGADSGGDDADTDSRPLDATIDHELHDATIDQEPHDVTVHEAAFDARTADATDETIEVEDTKPMDGGVVPTPCSSATDCPPNEACEASVCSSSCSASSPCNGGCCDGAMCQPGSDPGACGVTGGSCVTCSGASACLPTGTCGCASASECGEGQACTDGVCSAVCSDSSPCNGACCFQGCCSLFPNPATGPSCLGVADSVACGPPGGQCTPCNLPGPYAVCNPDYTCTCRVGSLGSPACGGSLSCAVGCSSGQACVEEASGTGQVCGTSCSATRPCNGTCCTAAGQCAPYSPTGSPTACGGPGTMCVDCTSNCATNGPGGGKGGNACLAADGNVCGCNSDTDCSLCATLTTCDLTAHVCGLPPP
jgi:hypothetical protein